MLHRIEEDGKHRTVDLRFASCFHSSFIPLLNENHSFINAVLTGLFLWPVARSSFRNNRVKRLAVRTLWSALIALTTSCVNILILTLMHGRQLGWVCLGSCGTDVGSPIQLILNASLTNILQVIVNALVIYWVTPGASDDQDKTPTTSPSNPGSNYVEPQRMSKALFKMGRPKRDSPTGIASMQVIFLLCF